MNIIESKEYREQVRRIARTIPERDCTVLITGASGLIGSCLTDVLLDASNNLNNKIKVIVLGRNEEILRKRFSYANPSTIRIIAQDIRNPLEIQEPIDYIINSASNADPRSYSLYPVETILTNVYGNNNLLEYCKKNKKTRILLTSTFEVYGKIDGCDIFQEDSSGEIDLNAIRSCYPESKRCAENLLRCYVKEYGVDGLIARLCSVYGPTMLKDDSKAHAEFIRNGIEGKDIRLISDGKQVRTYCYVMDAVSAILVVLFRGNKGESYNISNEKSVASIAEVADTVANIVGTNVIYALPEQEISYSRPQNCILDNHKLRDMGWSGQYTLKEGLSSTIHILKEILS